MRKKPNPPRRVQFSNELHRPQTPRLYWSSLASLVQVAIQSLPIPIPQRTSFHNDSIALKKYLVSKKCCCCCCCRDRWHRELPAGNGTSARELYISRHTALHQFKFSDPFAIDCRSYAYRNLDHLLLHQNNIIFAQVILTITNVLKAIVLWSHKTFAISVDICVAILIAVFAVWIYYN